MKRLIAAALLMATPTGTYAHPHIFVDAGLEVIFDDAGLVSHVAIIWEYDELYSLLITEDMGLDDDFDGELTAAELEKLNGFDQDWLEGYYGDTRAYLGGVELGLSRPVSYETSFSKGRITSRHVRALEAGPVALTAQLDVRPYDETYYTAYDVTKPVRLTGRDDCTFALDVPDVSGAMLELQKQLQALDAGADSAVEFPQVGAKFATTLRVTCPGS